MADYFLCGIGGSGMSALAALLTARRHRVAGSDRSNDRGETPEKFARLAVSGIDLFPQDGSGPRKTDAALIVSSAVEESVPDVQAARRLGLPVRTRADLLAELFNAADLSIAIGGTSGKSTVTAMTGWILTGAGRQPTIVNGAIMNNFSDGPGLGNMAIGRTETIVAEVDESDGSIALFRPAIAVVTNVTLDHKPMADLQQLFTGFIGAARKAALVNLDDPESRALRLGDTHTFSLADPSSDFQARDIRPAGLGVKFIATGMGQEALVDLPVPGRHNVANALAALGACCLAGVPLLDGAAALAAYRGIRRRFEIVGAAGGITVIDDFAHNPDKIAATLRTLHETPGRVLAIFQPHGFGPTKLMRADLERVLVEELRADDLLIMPEIYYAGGTAARDISAGDIIEKIAGAGREALFIPRRSDIPAYIASHAKAGDRVVVMGARDDTLPAFARTILDALKGEPCPEAK